MNFDKEDYSAAELARMFNIHRTTLYEYKSYGWLSNGFKKTGSSKVWYKVEEVITLYKKLEGLGKLKVKKD